ncbi:hypothetical protein HC928_14430, partial [bacterium]|nr:hypothetical protein [bacterium]
SAIPADPTATDSLVISDLDALVVTKTFSETDIYLFDSPNLPNSAILTITIQNPNGVPLTGLSFTDVYPAGLRNVAPLNVVTDTCGGTLTTIGLGTELAYSGGTLDALGGAADTCTIEVEVEVTTLTPNPKTNATGLVTTTEGAASTGATADLGVLTNEPILTKAFAPANILPGDVSVLTISVENLSPSFPATLSVALLEALPVDLEVADPPGATNSCASFAFTAPTAGDTTLTVLAGQVIPPATTCTVSVNVTGDIPGGYDNIAGDGVASGTISDLVTNFGTSSFLTGPATLTIDPLAPVDFTKAFAPDTVAVGGTSTLTFTLINPNGVDLTTAVFTDTLPADLEVAALPNVVPDGGDPGCALNFNPTLVGGDPGPLVFDVTTLPANATCTLSVDVTPTVPGPFANTADLTTDFTPATGIVAPAAADLFTAAPTDLVVTKSFSPAVVPTGAAALLTVTIENPNALDVTTVDFTDIYPAGLTNAFPLNVNDLDACGFDFNIGVGTAAFGNQLDVIDGIIPANSTCIIQIEVTAPQGTYTNDAFTVTTAEGRPALATAPM